MGNWTIAYIVPLPVVDLRFRFFSLFSLIQASLSIVQPQSKHQDEALRRCSGFCRRFAVNGACCRHGWLDRMGAFLRHDFWQEPCWNGAAGKINHRESRRRNPMCLRQVSRDLLSSRLTWLAAMGVTLCAEIPNEVLDTIKRLGRPNMVPAKESSTFPKKGQRMPSNYPVNFLSP
jgi:hypothetical protein